MAGELMEHFILTRFNVNLGWDHKANAKPGWLEHRVRLFEKWTLPSVKYQSCQGFRWLIFFRENSPDWLLEKAEDWPCEAITVPDHQCYAQRWSVFLSCAAQAVVLRANSLWNVQTRLDNDDALSWDFVQRIQDCCEEREKWINPRNGVLLDRRDGVFYWREGCRRVPFSSLIQRLKPDFYCCYDRHEKDDWEVLAKVQNLDGPAAWLLTTHGRNQYNRPERMPTVGKVECDKFRERFPFER